jgi:hypothetical protein
VSNNPSLAPTRNAYGELCEYYRFAFVDDMIMVAKVRDFLYIIYLISSPLKIEYAKFGGKNDIEQTFINRPASKPIGAWERERCWTCHE